MNLIKLGTGATLLLLHWSVLHLTKFVFFKLWFQHFELLVRIISCHQNGYIWSIVPHGLMLCLWRERNSRRFEDIESPIPDLKIFIFRTLSYWLFALQNKSFPSFFDFLDSCNFRFWFVVPLFIPCVLRYFPFWYLYILLIKKEKKKERKFNYKFGCRKFVFFQFLEFCFVDYCFFG